MNLVRDWYFVQVGPLDPRAAKLPLPDDLMGQLLAYVVAHEVGHTLGFQHNMKASSMYPADKVRDREWVKKMGHTPTLDGLLALQLRRAARGPHRPGRPDSANRPLRSLGHDVGLQADPRRATRRTTRRRRSTNGRGSRTRRRGCASRPPMPPAPDPGRVDRSRRRRRRREVDDDGPQESRARLEHAAERRRPGRASRTTIWRRPTGGCSASGCSR